MLYHSKIIFVTHTHTHTRARTRTQQTNIMNLI